MSVSAHDLRRLAVECHRCVPAIRNAIAGTGKPVVREQVVAAAARLGIQLPKADQ